MLYPKNMESKLSQELFDNPTAEYRGAPFWAWNSKLDKSLLLYEIDCLQEMGLGGFHIHSRYGLDTQYLGGEFLEFVKACNEKAKENNMLCWLYDEDRWPSGSAGGLVTKDVRYRERYLVFSPILLEEGYLKNREEFDADIQNGYKPKGYFIAAYQITLENGYLAEYKRISYEEAEENKESKMWWAYMEIASNHPWFNNKAYVNTLDTESIKKFVEVTHEMYFKELGENFGKSIPGIFTDEPQFSHKEAFRFAEEERRVTIPFTDDFGDTYMKAFGYDLLDFLPELFWELPEGKVSVPRYHYHDHLGERFVSAYVDTIGKWCETHGIMFTGHIMDEATLMSQTGAVGDAMRCYRSFQLPGIDIICDEKEYSTAKQAQSVAHQFGRSGVLSELYGVTNWDFDFKGHKLQGDWQAALGITTRVHHLSWVSMEGEAKRDYPASIGYQSPWYREYKLIEDHFSRLNTALTRGKPKVRIGVIHPVESYWLCWGPREQSFLLRDELETNFNNLINWMLFGLLDFDFISESLLPSQCPIQAQFPMKLGEMEYDIIVVPDCRTLRSTTVERLEAFAYAGGSVIFAGETAKLVDAEKSDWVKKLSEKCVVIPFTRNRMLTALENYRDIDIRDENGDRTNHLFYQIRLDGENRWLFVCHGEQAFKKDLEVLMKPNIPMSDNIKIMIQGQWNPVVYDTMDGEIYPYPAETVREETHISYKLYIHDSILFFLEPGTPKYHDKSIHKSETKMTCLEIADPVPVTLSEPNVLMLDMAEYSFDGDAWHTEEEILRIDNAFREKLKIPLKTDCTAQPWVMKVEDEPVHFLALKFSILSEIEIKSPSLALENAEKTQITVNGIRIPSAIKGWFVDKSIKTVDIPTLHAGKSEIILRIPFGQKTNVEWCYLLGDFGVRVEGRHKRIIEPVRTLCFGDWTNQGLPFYAGNVTYHYPIVSVGENMTIEATQFENPLLSVQLDGVEKGKIAFAPYQLALGFVEKGKHSLGITAFGNRINTFGAVHNCDKQYWWSGPIAWRTKGNRWSYQYQLKPMGILISPKILS